MEWFARRTQSVEDCSSQLSRIIEHVNRTTDCFERCANIYRQFPVPTIDEDILVAETVFAEHVFHLSGRKREHRWWVLPPLVDTVCSDSTDLGNGEIVDLVPKRFSVIHQKFFDGVCRSERRTTFCHD